MKDARTGAGMFFGLRLFGVVSLFVLSVLSISVRAVGTGSFTPHPTTPSFGGGNSLAIALGDLDGDGDLDAVVTDGFGQGQTVWLDIGGGNFSAHPTTPSFGTEDSRNVALGDLDGDGDLDAVIANVGAETVWLNNGLGSFSAHPTTPSFGDGNSNDVALGDLDGDGDLDAVIANLGVPTGPEAETVWVNDGDGGFIAHPTTPSFGSGSSSGVSTSVALGDLDGDGDQDAVVASSGMGASETVWVNDGNGSLSPHPTTPFFGAGVSLEVALGDLDGDGDLDAVIANTFGEAETVWVNNGAGSFTPHPTTPAFGAGDSFGVALGDLDGDSDLDAVIANGLDQAETVWVNNGAGSFTPHPTTQPFAASNSADVALGDLDGDGDLDAIVANFTTPQGGNEETVWINLDANQPPTAVIDSYATNEDQTLTVAAPGVLGNDTDPNAGDTRTAVLVSGPSHAASFTLNANGSFSYAPVAGYTGPDSFSYKARDNAGAESVAVAVNITVTPNTCGITVGPATLKEPHVVELYYQPLSASPSGQYTFSVSAGALPPGLNIYSIGNSSFLSGFPTTPGTYTFTIKAKKKNSACAATRAYTVTVPPTVAPQLTCVVKTGNKQYTARFGYDNTTGTAVTIPVGANNYFTPGNQNRGQVTVFQPGRVTNAFSVTFTVSGNSQDIAIWFLKGPDGVKRPVNTVNITTATLGCP